MSWPRWIIAAAVLGVPTLWAGVAWAARPRARIPADKWGLKPLRGRKATWLRELVDEVGETIEDGDMPLSVAIGQAAIETGWGKAGINNPWGIRGSGDAGSDFITTTEVFDPAVGKVTLQNQKFARFSSPAAAARGYVRFLSGPRYREGWELRRRDPGAWLLWLWGSGYATSTNYAKAVLGTSRKAAVTLDDPRLVIPWTPRHDAIAAELSTLKPGSARRQRTRELLAL